MEPITIPNPIDTTGRGFGQSDPGRGGGQGVGETYNTTTPTRPRPNFHPGMFREYKGEDTSQAPLLVGVGGALVFFSLCLLAARLWTRIRPVSKLGWDDWAILGGVILALVQYILIVVSVLNGLGHTSRFVSTSKQRTSLQLLFISQLFWYWSLTLIKLSVALLLLRIKYTKRWRIFLYSTMLLSTTAAIIQTLFQFLQCRPFSIYWDPRVLRTGGGTTTTVTCFRRSVISLNIVLFSSIQVILDLVFTFVPIVFIGKLNRPRREKLLMCVLMGLGVFASCAAVVRTLTVQGVRRRGEDAFQVNVSVALWAVVEQHFAIAAATIPTLKAFMEDVLVRVGWLCSEPKNEAKSDAKSWEKIEEKEIRLTLVRFGLLNENHPFDKDEAMRLERRESGASSIGGLEEQSEVKKDEFADFDFGMDKDDEQSLDEMLDVKSRDFV